MTQKNKDMKKISELNALFLNLDNTGQDSALTILRSLGFAQSVMCSQKRRKRDRKPPAAIRFEDCPEIRKQR